MKRFLLLIAGTCLIGFANAQCTDLFISEYAEGSGNNNGIEIYNPTANAIDLSGYVLKRYSNGSGTPSETFTLSGSLASGDVVVAMNGQLDSVWVDPPGYWSLPIDPVFQALGDLFGGPYPDVMYFNGDDAITLETTAGAIIDIFGKVGEDPGAAWTDDATAGYTDANGGTWWTKRQTLIRKPSVQTGVILNPISFNATLEWDSLPDDTWDSLGFHTCLCTPPVGIKKYTSVNNNIYVFPNPANSGSFTIKATSKISLLRVYNMLGKEILQQKPEANQNGKIDVSIDASHKGIYLAKIELENGSIVTKKILLN